MADIDKIIERLEAEDHGCDTDWFMADLRALIAAYREQAKQLAAKDAEIEEWELAFELYDNAMRRGVHVYITKAAAYNATRKEKANDVAAIE